MIRCPFCHFENETGALFCERCTSDLSSVTFGKYRIQSELAGGGMTTVYLVENTELNRVEVLEVLRPGDEHWLIDCFLRGANLATGLSHPNLCPIYETGVLDGACYVSMPYLDGHPLSDYVGTPQVPRKAVEVVTRLAQTMDRLHTHGVIHRNLQPSNVMMRSGRVPIVLLDLKTLRQAQQDQNATDEPGELLGTPAYLPPEQITGKQQEVGPASDVYSLGVILYELLTGHRPFAGASSAEVLDNLMLGEATPPSLLRPELVPMLDTLCATAMARVPQQRYPSMKAFAAALAEFLLATPPTELESGLIPNPPKVPDTSLAAEPPTVAPPPDPLNPKTAPIPSLPPTSDKSFGFEPNALRFQECGVEAAVADRLSRRFLFVRPIHSGGMGQTVMVQERTSGRFVAMKVMHEQSLSSLPHVQQFIREAVITARLQHPYVIPVYDLGFFEHQQLYYTMRYVEGAPFGALLASGKLSVVDRLRVLRCAALAVHYAHSVGLWHRDLKPHNIMVGKLGDSYVIDWGLVSVQPGREYKLHLPEIVVQRAAGFLPDDLMAKTDNALTTCTSILMGTPKYMAPEQFTRNQSQMGIVSDVWAFGIMLFEALTGQHPLGTLSLPMEIFNRLQSPLPRPSTVCAVPPQLDELCGRMLSRDVDRRPSSLEEFIATLEKALTAGGAGCHTFLAATLPTQLQTPKHLLAGTGMEATVTAVDNGPVLDAAGQSDVQRLRAECERYRLKNALLMELVRASSQNATQEKELLLKLAELG